MRSLLERSRGKRLSRREEDIKEGQRVRVAKGGGNPSAENLSSKAWGRGKKGGVPHLETLDSGKKETDLPNPRIW